MTESEATIVYDDPEEGTIEHTVDNRRIAYFQDHWIVKVDEDEAGNDVVRRIPAERVHYVERTVPNFQEEVKSVRDQVESLAQDVRSKLLGGKRDRGTDRAESTQSEPYQIDVEQPDENEGK